jgi:phytoene/squalene synthetase
LEERVSEVERELSRVERTQKATGDHLNAAPAPQLQAASGVDMLEVQEVMDDLEKKIMGNVAKDFERKGEVSKPKKKQMMFAQDEMVGQS